MEADNHLKEELDALHTQVTDLKRANADLEHFAHIISRGLRDPLTSVGGGAELLAARYAQRHADQLDPAIERYIQIVIKGTDRMKDMVRALTALTDLAGHAQLVQRISLRSPLRRALALLSPPVDARIQIDELPDLEVDNELICQLFQHLIENALKFNAPPIVVRVSAERAGEAWRVSVRDNGVGFPPEDSERIFELFERLHPRGDYPGGGLGLGLARRIVERHGGQIQATAGPGGGAIFSFTLPDPPARAVP